MMIWKFPLAITDLQRVEVPKGAMILTVQAQAGALCLWAVVPDAQAKSETIVIEIIGTGIEAPAASRAYIATVQLTALVWHVFQRTEAQYEFLPAEAQRRWPARDVATSEAATERARGSQ